MEEQKQPKNYRVYLWKLFGIGIVINLFSMFGNDWLSLLGFIITIVWLVFWIKAFNQAWKAVGKKHGWIAGLIAIVPFGAIIGIAIAYHYLKNTDYWKGEYKSFRIQK